MATETPGLYQPSTLFRVRKCAGISASDYIRAQRELQQQRRAAESIFEQVDVVVTPTTPAAAPKISTCCRWQSRNCEPSNQIHNAQYFAVQRPVLAQHFSAMRIYARRAAVGMQISGRPGQDAAVLRLAYAYEQATEWHNKHNKKIGQSSCKYRKRRSLANSNRAWFGKSRLANSAFRSDSRASKASEGSFGRRGPPRRSWASYAILKAFYEAVRMANSGFQTWHLQLTNAVP